jgi:hypothetical protein
MKLFLSRQFFEMAISLDLFQISPTDTTNREVPPVCGNINGQSYSLLSTIMVN